MSLLFVLRLCLTAYILPSHYTTIVASVYQLMHSNFHWKMKPALSIGCDWEMWGCGFEVICALCFELILTFKTMQFGTEKKLRRKPPAKKWETAGHSYLIANAPFTWNVWPLTQAACLQGQSFALVLAAYKITCEWLQLLWELAAFYWTSGSLVQCST